MEKETESEAPPSSIKKRRCGYKKDWENEYLWLKGVEGYTERAFCDLSKTSLSIGHGGEYDVNDTDTYVTLVKEKVFLNAVCSNKKYKFKKKPEGKKPSYVRPHLSKIKFD